MADIFDPATQRWSQLDIGCDAARSVQTLTPGGRLLIVCIVGQGIRNATIDLSARLFDPRTDRFADAAKPLAADSVATTLADGRILLTGKEPMIYEPDAELFDALPSGLHPDGGQAGTQLSGGRVLFLGDPTVGQSTLMFDPRSGTFAVVANPAFVSADAVVQLRDGRILTVGYRLEAHLLDPEQLPDDRVIRR